MRKFFISIFAFLYLGLSCGFAFDTHFCMGKYASVELFHAGDKNCGKCGMKSRKGCCSNKQTVVKITDSQQLSSPGLSIESPFIAIINYPGCAYLLPITQSLCATFTDTSPPPISGASRCILNSIFII